MKVPFLLVITFFWGNTLAFNIQNNVCTNVLSYYVLPVSDNCYYNPDVNSNIHDIVKRHNYEINAYSITTNDGYIINLYRLIKNDSTTKNPVFVLHGIAIDVEPWVAFGNRSLAFSLLEEGYDVWLGTFRGTINSNKHKTLNSKNPAYWEYNLDTIVANDVMKQIDFVYSKTNQKIIYIGHSMGTSVSFMYASEFPEKAQELLKGIFALAPVVYLNDIFLIKLLGPFVNKLLELLEWLNIKAIASEEHEIHLLLTDLCKSYPTMCLLTLSTISGKTIYQSPVDMILFLSYWPAGQSIYVYKQFLQIANSKRFQKYNFSTKINLQVYGSEKPPVYNLGNIKVPTFLFYGENDIFYRKQNIERLFAELGNAVVNFSIPVENSKNHFSHIDFVISKNITENLHNKLFEEMEKIK